MNCFLSIDKPEGPTSRDIVDRVCKVVGLKRVGHAGTLDPLATGVLVVALGKATRLVEYVQRMTKLYEAEFRLGQYSDTDDNTGMVSKVAVAKPPDAEKVRRSLGEFVGEIQQFPPQFSAKKVEGERAYDKARRHEQVTLQPKLVNIHQIDVLSYEFPDLRVRVKCGHGTYIRAIARDLGLKLRVGGLMSQLRRTAIGAFTADKAIPIDQLTTENWKQHALPLECALVDLPKATVDAAGVTQFKNGQRITWAAPGPVNDAVAVYGPAGQFLGIAQYLADAGQLQPDKGGFAEDIAEPDEPPPADEE